MLRRSGAEKRVDRNVYRRSTHVDKNPAFRLAGKLFSESKAKSDFRNSIRQSMQRSRPVGVGFGNYDLYGPDDSLRDIHDRDHYIVGESHGFGFDSPE
jgi:hypothetical protein